jgi:hypothetical protein
MCLTQQSKPRDFLDPDALNGAWPWAENWLRGCLDRNRLSPEELCEKEIQPLADEADASQLITRLATFRDIEQTAVNEHKPVVGRLSRAFEHTGLLRLADWLAETYEVQVFPRLGRNDGALGDFVALIGRLKPPQELVDSLCRRLGTGREPDQLPKAFKRFLAGFDLQPYVADLIRALDTAVRLNVRRYRVRALFFDTQTNLGSVRDIWIALRPALTNGGDVQVETPSWLRAGHDFVAAVKTGARAGFRFLGVQPNYVVQPLLPADTDLPLAGDSIGLAATVALIARLKGTTVNPGVAITGKVTAEGQVEAVGGIKEKVTAAAASSDIKAIILPAACRTDCENVCSGVTGTKQVFFIHKVDELFTGSTPIVIDEWEPYLKQLCDCTSPVVDDPADQAVHAILNGPPLHLLICRHSPTRDGYRGCMESVAARVAARRLTWTKPCPVPFLLHVDSAFEVSQLAARVQVEVNSRCGVRISEGLIHAQLRGEAVLLLYADDFSKPGIATCARKLAKYWLAGKGYRLVFGCSEGAAAVLQQELPDPVTQSRLAERPDSTFLARHVTDELAAIAKHVIWPCVFDGLGAQEFFDRGWIPAPVVEAATGEERNLEEMVSAVAAEAVESRGPQKLLLLGEGGTGKSAALLKLAFDCKHKNSELGQLGFVPWYVSAGDRLRVPGASSRRALFHGASKGDLRTPRLLLLVDGLDEVQLGSERTGDLERIGKILHDIVAELHPSSVALLASRPSREGSVDVLRARSLERHEFKELQIIERRWGREDLQRYLTHCMDRSERDANALLSLLSDAAPDLVSRPGFLYLFASAAVEELTRERRLTKATVYQAALQRWLRLEAEDNRKPSFGFDFPDSSRPADTLVGLAGRVAYYMAEKGVASLTDRELDRALEISGEPPDWWPLRRCTREPLAVRVRGAQKKSELKILRDTVRRLPIFRSLA